MNTESPNNKNENNGNIQMMPFTLEELQKYDGQDGMPAYVSVDGFVYDVSDSRLWGDGVHFGNIAGRELTVKYKSCHTGRPRIDQFPVIGYIVPTTARD